ncbi:peptidylprolyl isomerase [Alteromonas lipolytica]|uniref:Peptidyl-prolyl cis-trans isomerase n=1 Tax=Alteromonas lipolytica TaxID=1856405 RepID=A0A1E8FCP8_9ALTE|nr:peptidylprolyl isomerase [Alteromonas lipolytica]OFI33695.1 peptidylprolyl isomerase [Alteromonas lipolytica]GGF69282.1 peptidyl-prolyl cis-trans isomerase [Alteromonas lipolytica]
MLRALLLSLLLFSVSTMAAKPADDGSQIQPDNYYPRVKMETSMGDIVLELDRRRAPITVNNFLRYVDKRSYEGTIFQRIIPGYIVQGGGYTVDYEEKSSFPAIFNESGNGLKNTLYSVAMARQNDPHTATRQFFFNLDDNDNLDPGKTWGYTVFGAVVEGYEVVDAMGEVATEYKATLGFADAPVEPIIINKVSVLPAQF